MPPTRNEMKAAKNIRRTKFHERTSVFRSRNGRKQMPSTMATITAPCAITMLHEKSLSGMLLSMTASMISAAWHTVSMIRKVLSAPRSSSHSLNMSDRSVAAER